MKELLKSVKAFWDKFSKKTKIIALVAAVAVVAGAVIVALVLNHSDYVVLFSGLTDDDAAEVVNQLQDMEVEYSYGGSGSIEVPEEVADQTRAQLAQNGYPKSGFTYDVFTSNASGMTTDMEKETYKLYDLQNRIGATVRLFDGVKDAKVTIALSGEQKYVLNNEDEEETGPSASVVVVMKDNGSPSEKQAAGIQRLVARSVPEMNMDNVSVLDGNGIEISGSNSDNAAGTSQEIAQLIETQISNKVINVLSPFYGPENIRVSAKGTVDMEKVVREKTTYETPEKIDEKDKTGIVSGESTAKEASGAGAAAGGVAGTESNADVTEYNTETDGTDNGYTSESATRDYLVNQIKEQGELDPGTLSDLTVSVSINGSLGDLNNNQLRDLIGNATGIAAADRAEKITIANAAFYDDEKGDKANATVEKAKNYLPFIMAGVAALLLLIILFIIIRKKKKKKGQDELEEELMDIVDDYANAAAGQKNKAKPEILDLQNERSRELRESVREFAEENPEISAQMIKSWLHGGDSSGGGN